MKEVLKGIRKHKFSNLLMMVQTVLVIVYFFMVMAAIQEAFNICIEVPDILGDKYDGMVHCEIQSGEMDPEEFYAFIDTLKQIGIVDDLACYNTNAAPVESGCFGGEEIGNIQIEMGISQMADFRIQEGRSFQDSDLDGETVPLLAGCKLAEKYNVKTGDIVEDLYSDQKYEIVGILKENSRWFIQSISEGQVLSLDAQVVTVASKEETAENLQYHYYGMAGPGMSAGEAADRINDLAGNSHIILKAAALEDEVGQQAEKIWDNNIYWLIFSLLVMFMVAVGTASLAATHLYARKEEVGIRMALGYPPGRIVFLFAGEIILITLVSCGISCLAGLLLIGNGVSEMGSMTLYTGYVFSGKVAALGGAGAVCMCIPSLLVLAVAVRKLQPKNLMGGKE